MSAPWRMLYGDAIGGLTSFINDAEREMKVGVQDAALQAAIEGQEAGRHTIATTPSSLSPGKDNRIWTSAMFHAFESKVTQRGNTITITVGWIDEKEGYFLIQDEGGRGPHGAMITPMHALLNADAAVRRRLRKEGINVD